jgi:hypothetical protein
MTVLAYLFMSMALSGAQLAETEVDPDNRGLCGFISFGCLLWALFFWCAA